MKAVTRGLFLLVLISLITALAGAALDLKNIKEIGTFATEDPQSAEFYKDYLYIADGNSIIVYNTSNPEQPRRIFSYKEFGTSSRFLGRSISGDRLYAAVGSGWIYVLDISSPENPKKLYQLSYLNFANDVAVSGKYMYVADANTGILIFDLSDPRNPALAGSYLTLSANISGFFQGWGGKRIAVSGSYAFLNAASRQGLYIVDISDPASPRDVYHSIGKEIYDIAVSEDGVFLARADGTARFDLLDVSNPYAPKNLGNFSIFDSSERSTIAVHPSGNYIYAAADNNWHIFRVPDTTPPQITIEKPMEGETVATGDITVSGSAFDRSGVKEVLVNGKFAGTQVWAQTITLVEGTNSIDITAFDIYGNNITRSIQVTYRPVQPAVTTPAPVETTPVVEPVAKITPLVYGIIIAVLIILMYWLYKKKK